MSAQQARAKIGEMLNNGVISFEEAKRHQDRISNCLHENKPNRKRIIVCSLG